MEDDTGLSRRRLVELFGLAGLGGLAGCGGSGGPGADDPAARTATDTPPAPEFDFAGLDHPTEVTEGAPFEVRVDAMNVGGAAATASVTVTIGTVTRSKAVDLGPGETATVTFRIDEPLPADTYRLSVSEPATGASITGELRVAEPPPRLAAFVEVDGASFVLDGEPFSFHGGNNDMLGRAPRWYVDMVFEAAANLGFTALRTWAYAGRCFIGSCASESETILPEPDDLPGPVESLPPLNEVVLRRLDYAIRKANETGVRLVLPLLSNTESHIGSGDFVKYSPTAESHDDFYTDDICRKLYKEYVSALLSRTNTLTGREYRNDPGIMLWELVNEPDLLDNDGDTSIMQGWIEEMSAYLKSVDDNHLLSTGEIGLYEDSRPQSLSGKSDQGMDFIQNHQPEAIDVGTFHMYLNQMDLTRVEDGRPRWKTWVENHARDAHEQLEKPVYAGEFAPSNDHGDYRVDRRAEDWKEQDERRAEKYREIYDVFSTAGVDGAINWTFMIPFDFATDPVDDPEQWNAGVSVYPDDPHTSDAMRDYSNSIAPTAPDTPSSSE